MSKAKFDLGNSLAGILGNVSNPDAEEQITYIPLQNLVSDERNFYSMDGVDELAANIELIGLQQPLRVLAGENGFYVIVSGHRRAAAIRLLAEDTPEKWARVPCIVEKPGGSPELEELRLIMANADTRRMSSVDLAKQAERVEMLLYKLKEQGMEFPGRMRDHVAEACKVSRTKIAVLKVIRENLVSEWDKLYKKNEINETVAYELARQPAEVQKKVYKLAKYPKGFREWNVKERVEHIKEAEKLKCKPFGGPCGHAEAMLRIVHLEEGCHSCFVYGCCEKCYNFNDCKFVCPSLREKQAAARKEKRDARKDEIAREKARDQALVDTARLCWDRFRDLRTSAGLSVEETVTGSGRSYCGKWTEDRYTKHEANDAKLTPAVELPFANMQAYDVQAICKTADLLGCSTDYLLGHDDKVKPDSELISVDERYPNEGQYVIAYTRDFVAIPSVYFRAAFMDCTEKSVANNRLTGVEYWSPRPQLPAGKKWPGQETIEGMVKK